MVNFSDVLRSASGRSDTPEVLTRPTRDLLGVSEAAAKALSDVGIKTVFDLGASSLFAAARAVVASVGGGPLSNRFGLIAGDLLTDAQSTDSPENVGELPLQRLRMLSPEHAQALSTALDVTSISDLARWPPQREALRLLGQFTGTTEDPEDIQVEELRPRFGEYPTERVYYNTLIMLDMLGDSGPLQDLKGPVSLGAAVQQTTLTRPAIGALVTFEQSWYAQGVTLGHMLHSLSLAPGEATRVAVIDWSRRTTAFATETIGETEQLDTATTHARALSEVQQAVANDFQAGGSRSSSSATSTSHSEARTGSSGLLTSLFSSGSGSTTDQTATTTGEAESSSWSLGNRSILGSLTQNVNDRTEQHSSSVRNRRASAVREVSQNEHEQVSTRVVANYNHMHALNIQYYEVVQVYRTEARLHRADRCLFVPMEPLDFSGPNGWAVVERFRGALLAAALTSRAGSLLADDTTAVEISPVTPLRFPGFRPDLTAIRTAAVVALPAVATRTLAATSTSDALQPSPSAGQGGATASPPPDSTSGSSSPGQPPTPTLGAKFWDANAVAQVARFVDRPIVRPNSDSLFVPADTELIAISFDQILIRSVRIDRIGGSPANSQTVTVSAETGLVDLSPNAQFVELDAISVVKGDDAGFQGTMTLHCAYQGRRFTLPGIFLDLVRTTAPQKVATFTNDQADRRKELQQHLQNHRDYYSQAVFRSLDASAITFVLGRYQFNGKPLIDQVEPRPVTITGNYMVLRAPIADDEDSGVRSGGDIETWGALLKKRGLDPVQAFDRRLIPIPTGGVFAEAVLGRANSAEKLDITRFWHWEDSAIPLLPTEIAPVQTGSRATAEQLTPGQLSPPLLNIVNPTALPEPTSMSAMLNALAALNFRDMSGLAGTQGLVKAGEEGTLTAATEAGKLASENLKTEAQKAVSMGQIAGDIAKAAIAASSSKGATKGSGGSSAGVGGISRDGALGNWARRMDQAGTGGTSSGSMETGPSGSTAGGSDGSSEGSQSSGTSNSGGGSDQMMPAGGHELDAFKNALFGPLGASGLDAANIVLASAPKQGTGSGTTATSSLDRPAALREADDVINHFGSSTLPGSWDKTLDRNKVADRLLALVHNPDLVNQGANGLCGEAAFFHIWLSEDPLAVAIFGTHLYNQGWAYVGTPDLTYSAQRVTPRQSLRGQNFKKVVEQMKQKSPFLKNPDQWGADWMMMSALRDQTNKFFSYDGTPSDEWGSGSSDSEMARWLRATQLFRSVDIDNERNYDHAAKLMPGNDVIMVANDSQMLGNPKEEGDQPDHWFVLKSAIVENTDGTVDFRLWSWGYPTQSVNALRKGFGKPALLKTQFADWYYGYVVGRR